MSRRARARLPRHVRVYVEGILCCYDADRQRLKIYRDAMIPSAVPQYGGSGGGGQGESRPAEALGVRLADDRYLRELERTVTATERVLKSLDKLDRRLVQLVYIKKTHTVSGAAMALNMGRTMAFDHVNAVLWTLAGELGLAYPGMNGKNTKKIGFSRR